MIQNSVYHVLLRISALTLALVLLFVSGVLSPVTQQIAQDTSTYLANVVSASASVPQNEVNTLSAGLAKRNVELTQREIAVSLKEKNSDNSGISTFVLSILLFIILVLLILNYALDYLRSKPVVIKTIANEKVA